MITLEDQVDTRPVKVDWYWNDKRREEEDNKLSEINPFFVIKEVSYPWEAVSW